MISRASASPAGGWVLLVTAALIVCGSAQAADERNLSSEEIDRSVRQILAGDPILRVEGLERLTERAGPEAAPGLIQVLRFNFQDGDDVVAALRVVTGANPGTRWHDWMLWQQAHPEIKAFDGFDGFKADVMARLDPNFRQFLQAGVAHDIRLEEIVWGGVIKDGIPALIDPVHVRPQDADYLRADEPVFGIEINGDARAYPLRILDWHEMFNDVIGGVPLALAYCTLCGSGILYETTVPGQSEPFVFGSSGFLYRSNKLMYDRQTHSLWNQFTGRPVVGPLTGSGIELAVRPVTITSWRNWLERHPDTKVLSLDTGYDRDYTPGRPYGDYFASPDLMFPALVPDIRHAPKDFVFVLRAGENEMAWPLSDFEGGRVINDSVGDLEIVLIGDATTRTVRSYESGGRAFVAGYEALALIADGEAWRIEEEALIGPGGARLARLPGHIAFWFAWSGFSEGASLSGE